MAQAVKRFTRMQSWRSVRPLMMDFYWDIDSDKTLTSEDFPAIEAEMKKDCEGGTLR